MSPIWLLLKFRTRLDILKRFAKADNRDYAPMSLIWLQDKSMIMLERLRRLAKGYNRD